MDRSPRQSSNKLRESHKRRVGIWGRTQTVVRIRGTEQARITTRESSPLNPREVLMGLQVGRSVREYPSNETVFFQGDTANAVFYVERGEVKLSVLSKNGKQAIVDIIGENAFFGEGCLAGEPVRVATAITLQSSRIIRLEKRALFALFRSDPLIAEVFVSQLASRNLRMQADLADHIFNSSEKRLARLLLNLAKTERRPGIVGVISGISQETLAEMVGTTRPRVSYFLNRFRDLGFISYTRNAIEVRNSLKDAVSREKATDPKSNSRFPA